LTDTDGCNVEKPGCPSPASLWSTRDEIQGGHPMLANSDDVHPNSPTWSPESISPRTSWSSAERVVSESPPTSPEPCSTDIFSAKLKSFATRDELDGLKRIVIAQQQEIRTLTSLLEHP